ncbi:MAG: ATP-binding protein [Nitrospiraceae bacterium]|nr:ATP-binding protein [Nitrospiraceae bacterium]
MGNYTGNLTENQVAILAAIETGIPLMAWGGVGLGKTDTAKTMAQQLGFTVILDHPSHHPDASAFGGYHFIDHKERGERTLPLTRRSVPEWLERALDASEKNEKIVIILDEYNLAAEDVLKETLGFLRGKRLGPIQLPIDTPVILLNNPPNMALYPTPIEVPVQTRVMMHQWKLEEKAVIDYFKSGGQVSFDVPKIDENWKKRISDSMYVVGMFLESRPDLISNVPEDPSMRSEMDSYSVPRTWEYMATLRTWAQARGLSDKEFKNLAKGLVGKGAGNEFVEFAAKNDIGNPEVALSNPLDFTIPDRGDRVIALVNGIAEVFGQNPTEERWKNAWTAIGRIFSSEYQEAAMSAARKMREKNVGGWPEPAKLRSLLGEEGEAAKNNNLGSILTNIKKR